MKKVKKWTSTSSGSSPWWWAAAMVERSERLSTRLLDTTSSLDQVDVCVLSVCYKHCDRKSVLVISTQNLLQKDIDRQLFVQESSFWRACPFESNNRQPLVGLEDDLLDDLGKTKTSNLFFVRSHGILTRIFCITILKCRANYLSSSFYSYPVFCGTERGQFFKGNVSWHLFFPKKIFFQLTVDRSFFCGRGKIIARNLLC